MHPASRQQLIALGIEPEDLAVVESHLRQAVSNNWAYATFANALSPIFQTRSFWKSLTSSVHYKNSVLENVLRDAFSALYSRIRWGQTIRLAKRSPYLRYVALIDGTTDPMCASLHGRIYHVDSDVWKTLYPPNHAGCRCSVSNLSMRDVNEFGYQSCIEDSNSNIAIDHTTGEPIIPKEGYAIHPYEANTICSEIVCLKLSI